MGAPTAFLGANIPYSAGLRDFLLRLAERHLYSRLWSACIHTEWMRSLLANRPDPKTSDLEYIRATIDERFPDALVTWYEARHTGPDLPDAGDIHVLAAAIEAAAIDGGADLIATRNLRDFPADGIAPHGLAAQDPDDFIAALIDADLEAVLEAVHGHRAALKNPPRTADEHLVELERVGLPRTVALIQPHHESIRPG